MELAEALRHALDGNAVLFLGAGFSLGATNKHHDPFPLASGLAAHLMTALKETEVVPLQTAAALYIRRHGEVGLLTCLEEYLGVSDVASHHETFAEPPWRRVYTTNYDGVFEAACQRKGIGVVPAVATGELTISPSKKLSCVHLNGFLPWAKVGNLVACVLDSQHNLRIDGSAT